MASKFSLFLLLTLLSSLHTHARDSQFFNKIPSTTTTTTNKLEATNNQQQQQEPNFLPENENSYGLYGHESGQNPPSTTTTNPEFDHKYLPKNYNPVAYVTQPEDVKENTAFTEERSFTTNPDTTHNYYNGAHNYYNNNQQQGEGEGEAQEEEAEFRSYPTTTNNNRDSYYYNGGSSFNSQPQGRSNYFNNGGANGFQPQGMSDTRVVANGKYFYDINSEKYSSNHPYETLRAQNEFNNNANEFNNRNFYGNNANEFTNRNLYGNNANEFNSRNSANEFYNRNFYVNNADEFNAGGFQNEENMP